MDDNSLRLIRGQWDWSGTPAFDSMTEYQMRHVIYPDTPIISTPVKIRASIGDTGEGLVEPWLNFYIISFITGKDLEGGSSHSDKELQLIAGKFN